MGTQFLRDFIDQQTTLFWYIPTSHGYPLCMPILIIHWITLCTDHWFRTQGVLNVAILAPNVGELFTNIELGKHWEPTLPQSLLQDFRPSPSSAPYSVPIPTQVSSAPPTSTTTPSPTGAQGGGEPSGTNPIPNKWFLIQ